MLWAWGWICSSSLQLCRYNRKRQEDQEKMKEKEKIKLHAGGWIIAKVFFLSSRCVSLFSLFVFSPGRFFSCPLPFLPSGLSCSCRCGPSVANPFLLSPFALFYPRLSSLVMPLLQPSLHQFHRFPLQPFLLWRIWICDLGIEWLVCTACPPREFQKRLWTYEVDWQTAKRKDGRPRENTDSHDA